MVGQLGRFHAPAPVQCFGDRQGTTKKVCDKGFAELSCAICLKNLAVLGSHPVVPSNCSEYALVLFVRF